MRTVSWLLLTVLFLVACGPGPDPDPEEQDAAVKSTMAENEIAATAAAPYEPAHDYFSFANTREFTTRHLDLELEVDFQASQLRGQATLHMRRIDPNAGQIIFDSQGLVVTAVHWLQPGMQPLELAWQPGGTDPVRGTALIIGLPGDFQAEDEFQVRIAYHTGPEASALMWLPPELTAGKKHPFMFTQSQSIHARSWIPLQDTPSMRITYAAQIKTPAGLLALMSADNDPLAERDGSYRFSMPQAIPPYLLALAVGNVFFESFGEDTGVYAEPEVLAAAAHEFADTQAMLDVAENIYGPYQWGRYDLLILPPSFPFGGMENPRLSFITPTVLAGDRSLTSLIAHELAHSWSGNLVSNATWRDIWLNEGTTSYLEARLMEVLYGRERADEERLLSYQDLLEKLNTVPAAMQALAPRFDTGDPDVGQDGLEYSKGQLLLENLEGVFGREVFDEYMAGYFRQFAMQAIGSEQFLDYADVNLLQKYPGKYTRGQLEQWLYQPGLPADAAAPTSVSLERAAAAAAAWSSGELPVGELPYEEWSPQATVYFIKALPPTLTSEQLRELDEGLGLSQSGNAEIARAWFMQVAARRHLPAYAAMRAYLGSYGRTRLVKPVYEALVKNGQDRGLAKTIFAEVNSTYHPLTVAEIQRLF
ncbi:MAG TPA: M1 family metallopeptidase [Xanthomonadales bacterium]|nr:M1 family metallopeptidase [Xanthomonadales bacterium]